MPTITLYSTTDVIPDVAHALASIGKVLPLLSEFGASKNATDLFYSYNDLPFVKNETPDNNKSCFKIQLDSLKLGISKMPKSIMQLVSNEFHLEFTSQTEKGDASIIKSPSDNSFSNGRLLTLLAPSRHRSIEDSSLSTDFAEKLKASDATAITLLRSAIDDSAVKNFKGLDHTRRIY